MTSIMRWLARLRFVPRSLQAAALAQPELPAEYERVKGFSMNNNCYFVIDGFKLKGSDTLRFSFSASDACNVLGCYQGTSSTDNYSLYVSTSGSYLRYNGGTYDSSITADERYDVTITPTGSTGMKKNSTWTAKTFTSANDLCIGTTSTTASSAKLKGSLYGNIEIAGRLKLVPCKKGTALGYYDTYSKTFYAPASGTPTALT